MLRRYLSALVDVLLLVLIVFFASLPLTQMDLGAALPPPQPPARPAIADAQVFLEYAADGRLSINGQPVLFNDLHERLAATFRNRADKTLYVMGDASLPYRLIIEAIDIAKGAGVERVGIVTESMRKR